MKVPKKVRALAGSLDTWYKVRDFQLARVFETVTAESRVLDVGCGPLRTGLPLIDHLEPSHYTGVDVRAEAIAAAEALVRKAGWLETKEPRLIQADFTALKLDEEFDVILAFSVLHHLEDAVLSDALAWLAQHLAKPHGVIFAIAPLGRHGNVGDWQGFPTYVRSWGHYVAVGAKHGLRVMSGGPVEAFNRPGEHFIRMVHHESR